MKNFLLRVLFLLSIGHWLLVIGHSGFVRAQSRLTYPIPELGYCRDAKECSLYCAIPENKAACWSYGKYKLGPQILGVSSEEERVMEEKAKKYGITFPIAELGNCGNIAACRAFCEQTANHQTCMDFARKKGFAQEMDHPPDGGGIPKDKKQEIMASARSELGCSSMESCRTLCETDMERCMAFAKRHGLHKEPPQAYQQKVELLKKAREDLGCTSFESCRTMCETNPERCMQFAKKHGFDQGEHGRPQEGSADYGRQRFEKKGGCDSEESCRRYCQEHPNECPGYQGYERATEGRTAPSTTPGSYAGPSGCRTEEECKQLCQANPDKCPGFKEAHPYPTYAPPPSSGWYYGPTGGYAGPTGYQYNYSPTAYPTYTPTTTYPEPTPLSYPTYSPTPTTQP